MHCMRVVALFCVVWFDVVWCGLVWFGVVWGGVLWFGLMWRGEMWCCVVWYGEIWCGLVWCCEICCQSWRSCIFHNQKMHFYWILKVGLQCRFKSHALSQYKWKRMSAFILNKQWSLASPSAFTTPAAYSKPLTKGWPIIYRNDTCNYWSKTFLKI